MSAEMYTLLGIFFVQGSGILAVWIKARSAERLSKPTGNGFAKYVLDALGRIEGKIDRHLETHASGGMKHK